MGSENVRRFNIKKILLWVIVISLSFGLGAFYQAKSSAASLAQKSGLEPTPTPQLTWVVYVNNQRNFTFHYPSNWYVDPTSSNTQLILRKRGSDVTSITFDYLPSKAYTQPGAYGILKQKFYVGKNSPIIFTDYFGGLGARESAHASFAGTAMAASVSDITVNFDVNNTYTNTLVLKDILASMEPVK